MSMFRRKATPPPLRRDQVLVTGRAAEDLERAAVVGYLVDRIEAELDQQSDRPGPLRNAELVDVLLDLRLALRPPAPGSQVLRPTAQPPLIAPLPTRRRTP